MAKLDSDEQSEVSDQKLALVRRHGVAVVTAAAAHQHLFNSCLSYLSQLLGQGSL